MSLREEYGLACPQCGHDEDLSLTVTTGVLLTANGTNFDPMNGDEEWDNDSDVSCPKCTYAATVSKFRV